MKIVSVVGTRPQFVKLSAISRAIKKWNDDGKDFIDEVIVHTGQHYDKMMSSIFFNELEIPKPDYNLWIGSGTHGRQIGKMIEVISGVLADERPGVVMVYGDSNTTLAGAIATKHLHIKLAHVEAGVRSYNMAMPEEINRVLTDRIADTLFCPNLTACENLYKEGIYREVLNFGDVMLDNVEYYYDIAKKNNHILEKLGIEGNEYILLTVHREGNMGDNLQNIIKAIKKIDTKYPIIFPAHPRLKKELESVEIPAICIDPVSYLDMLQLLRRSRLVLTDSGGLQKEAFFFGVPCITLRDETEWVDTLIDGWNVLVGADTEKIVKEFKLISKKCRSINSGNNNAFGYGNASEKIVEALVD